MARQKGSRTGRCQGCNHPERVRIERLLAAGASIKGAARKFAIDYHALRRHWINHVSAEARAAYIAGAGATKDQLEAIVADESLALIDHHRIVRGSLYKGFGVASEVGDSNSPALLAGRLHENFRDCSRLTGELRPYARSCGERPASSNYHSASTLPQFDRIELAGWRGGIAPWAIDRELSSRVSGRMNSQKRSPYRDLN
jgi:hypothetical protein